MASATATAAAGHDETRHGNAWDGRDGWNGWYGYARWDGCRPGGSDGSAQDGRSAGEADDGPADANDGEAGNASSCQHGRKPGETFISKNQRPNLTKNILSKQPRPMQGYKFTPTVRNPQFQVQLLPALLLIFQICVFTNSDVYPVPFTLTFPQQMVPRHQMMVAPGGGVGAPLAVPAGGVGAPLGGGAPTNGGVAQPQPAVLVQGQVLPST